MSECCKVEIKNKKIVNTLWIVLWINFIVFFVQFIAASVAHSSSLLLVFYFQSKWPDIIVGFLLTIILFKSAIHIIRLSMSALKNDPHLGMQV